VSVDSELIQRHLSQQRRAINLIDALVIEGLLCAGSRIAIVGAGAAGLTAAVRAAQAGVRAHVLERESEILATFRGNHNRLLHPNLYAWPARDWLRADAELPVMTWSAAPAGVVVRTLDKQFREMADHTGLIACTTSAVVHWPHWPQSPGRRGSLLEIAWRDRAGAHVEAVSAVILAVGFGREPRTAPGTPFPGYWDNDPLDQTAERRTVLIQGTGDGGLTDALRLRIRNFYQASTFEELLVGDNEQRLAERVAEIEALEPGAMDAAYRALNAAWLDDAIRAHGLRPHDVTLVGISPTFGPGRFPLNKLLVSRLQAMKELRIVELPSNRRDFTIGSPDHQGILPPVDIGDGLESFDVALIRVGKGNALGSFGTAIVNGAAAMVSVSGNVDGAMIPPMLDPPPAASLAALAIALDRSERLLDVVETILLYLRRARTGDEIAAEPQFERHRDEIDRGLRSLGAVAVAHAPGVLAGVRARLTSGDQREAEVLVRALAEAVDYHYGDRLLRSLRGPFGQRAAMDVGPCALSPRGLARGDPRGRRDNGLARLALLPSGSTTARIEWTQRAWRPDVSVAGVRVFESIEDLEMTGQRIGSVMRFFGATVRDRARHRRSLDVVFEQICERPPDFLLLSEFALLDHDGWAVDLHRADRCGGRHERGVPGGALVRAAHRTGLDGLGPTGRAIGR
jgi:hypothetical protein